MNTEKTINERIFTSNESREETAGILLAISIVAKRLAKRLSQIDEELERRTKDGQTGREYTDYVN